VPQSREYKLTEAVVEAVAIEEKSIGASSGTMLGASPLHPPQPVHEWTASSVARMFLGTLGLCDPDSLSQRVV
jgi:hypothetical protein